MAKKKSTFKNPPSPAPFLTVRGHVIEEFSTLHGLCVGYENRGWRLDAFVDHIITWLPEFALSPSEWLNINHANSAEMLRHAALTVYKSNKFKKRGEFGELFLHAAIRQTQNSLPAISKIFYKTSLNDTVKGFDAVHVVGPPNDMELWLGEAKFFKSVARAIREVIKELEFHLGINYLRDELFLLAGKLDDSWPHAPALRNLLSRNTSLDEVFKRACIPVLLTYDSECLTKHSECTHEYIADFETEVRKHYQKFLNLIAKTGLPKEIRIHLFLFPLATKDALIVALDRKLKLWQQL